MIPQCQDFKRNFKNYSVARTTSPRRKVEAKKTGKQPWQQHHGKAKDAMRFTMRDGMKSCILERFQKDLRYKEAQSVHGRNETWCKYLDCIRTVDISHNASRAQRERYAKMWRFKKCFYELSAGTNEKK